MTRSRLLLHVVGLSAAVILTACKGATETPHASNAASASHDDDDDDEDDDRSSDDGSIFDLPLDLVDQNGTRLALRDLQGRVMVAAMTYTTCTSVCPRITEDMKAIEAQLSADAGRDVRFVLFSLDPGRDSPMALTRFAGEHRLNLERWRLLATSEDGVRNLAAVLGVKYAPMPDGEISHSAMIFVIDKTGVVRHRQVGLAQDSRPLVEALVKAQR